MKDVQANKDKIIINKTALILSGIFPGIGQIYKREYMKGIDLIIIQCVFIFFLFYPMRMLFPLGVILAPTLWVWSMADAGISLPIVRTRYLYSQLRKRSVLLVAGAWVFTVIVFASTAIIIKYKLNPSKSVESPRLKEPGLVVDEVPKLRLLTSREMIITPDDTPLASNPTDEAFIASVKEPQNSQPEESALTPTDMASTPEDTQPANVEATPERLPQIKAPNSKVKNPLSYIITIGAFSQYSNAERLRLQLSKKGYQTLITPSMSSSNQKVHAVVVPGFSTISDAKAIAHKMKREIDGCRDCFIATPDKPTVLVEKVD